MIQSGLSRAEQNHTIDLAERLLERLSTPYDLGGREVTISCSIGLSIYLDDAVDAEALLSGADIALYRAKEGGRSTFAFFRREIRVARKLKSADVIDVLADLFIMCGVPGHIRSGNGSEFVAAAVKDWIKGVGAKASFIEPGSPWENGYFEIFNGELRDELLACEVFNSLAEARVLIEQWRKHYNTVWAHSAPGYRPPAPEAVMMASAMLPSSSSPTGSTPTTPAMH